MKIRKKILDYEYEEVLEREDPRVDPGRLRGGGRLPHLTEEALRGREGSRRHRSELKEAIAYGIIAPSGRAKNFVLSMEEELGVCKSYLSPIRMTSRACSFEAGVASRPANGFRSAATSSTLSMPVLLSSLFQRLVSIVDIFMVGGLGAAAIAATGLGQLLIFVVMTVFWGLATGATVVIAHLWGAGASAGGAARPPSPPCFSAPCWPWRPPWLDALLGEDWPAFSAPHSEVLALPPDYIRLVFLYLRLHRRAQHPLRHHAGYRQHQDPHGGDYPGQRSARRSSPIR